eukprot:13255760-Alexandrium_andersonii.AAC.1
MSGVPLFKQFREMQADFRPSKLDLRGPRNGSWLRCLSVAAGPAAVSHIAPRESPKARHEQQHAG